jgi:general secretion pathway protein D
VLKTPRVYLLVLFIAIAFLAGCAGSKPPERISADLLMEQGKWEEAIVAYQEMLKDDPFNSAVQSKLAVAKGLAATAYVDQGRAFLKEHKTQLALESFKRALLLDPSRVEVQQLVGQALRAKEAEDNLLVGQKLLKAGRLEEAAEALEQALQFDPSLTAAQDALVQVAEALRAAKTGPSASSGSRQPVTLKFQNARTKEVFEVLARAGGINFLFDKDLKDDPITIFVKDTTFDDALNLILKTQNLFIRRVAPDTILVVPKSKQKMDQYQDLMIRTFYISNGKAKDLVNLLRTMLESKRVYVNEEVNAIVIRDSPEKIKLAERIIYANDRKPGEVMFEIEVLEVDKTKSDRFGVNFPKQLGAALVPPGTTTFPAAGTATQFTYSQLTSLGPSSYLFLLPASIILDFFKSESDAKTLANPKLRVVNNKQGKINIGDKVPILLSTTSTIPGVVPGTIPTQSTITSIEFKDVGVKLSIEPTMHLNYQVSLKLQIEVTRLGDLVTLQDNPLIRQFRFGTRTAETTLTLKDGESVVLGGLIQDEDRTTVTKVPGLGDIPALGWVFKAETRDVVRTDVILTITPHIVRSLEMPNADEQAFWSGTEETYALKPLFTETAAVVDRSPALVSAMPPSTPPPTAPLNSAILSVRPPDAVAALGQPTTVELLVDNVEGLVESNLTITYDPKILEFREAQEGEFLKRGRAATMSVDVNPVAGTVALQLRRAEGDPGTSGGGVLASLTFLGKAPGVSQIGLEAPRLVSAGKGVLAAQSSQGVLRVR